MLIEQEKMSAPTQYMAQWPAALCWGGHSRPLEIPLCAGISLTFPSTELEAHEAS